MPDQIQEVQRFYSVQFVVRQTGVASGQTGMQRAIPVCGREAGVGQIRADEGVVPDGKQSCSRGQTWVGARQTKTDGDPGQTKTVAGEGTGTQTETGTDVDARTGIENSLGANGLRRLGRLGANTEVATVQTSKHNWTQKGFCTGGNRVWLIMCRCC